MAEKKQKILFYQKIFLNLIRFYQKFISPLLGRHCRFYPSCSEYSYRAIIKYGLGKGLAKSTFRVIRCGPWSKGGVDEP